MNTALTVLFWWMAIAFIAACVIALHSENRNRDE